MRRGDAAPAYRIGASSQASLDVDNEMLVAVKEIARARGTSAARVVSMQPLQQALSGGVSAGPSGGAHPPRATVAGFRPFAPRGRLDACEPSVTQARPAPCRLAGVDQQVRLPIPARRCSP